MFISDGCRSQIEGARGGVAMGLVSGEGQFVVLTDIAGQEDHYGDMDFKVAGTTQGITALQMDIKVGGITTEVLTRALDQARKGRLELLESMGAVLAAPRSSFAKNAPQMASIQLPKEKFETSLVKGEPPSGTSSKSPVVKSTLTTMVSAK